MLKWAVAPRSTDSDPDGSCTFQTVVEQHRLPCLIHIGADEEHHFILLCETNDPFLSASSETQQFAIPISFDGLFALVEHGATRYNVLPSVRSLLSHVKPSSSLLDTHFTTLKPSVAYHNASLYQIEPGTLLEPAHPPVASSISSMRLRTLFTSLPHSLNKYRSSSHPSKPLIKKRSSANEHLEVKSNVHDELLTLKSDSVGMFVPVYTQLPPTTSSDPTCRVQGLYTTRVLSKLLHQYPLIVELIVSRWLDEHASTSPEYPFRKLTVHRLVEDHRRMLAFDMRHNCFLELDLQHPVRIHPTKPTGKLFQQYQRQLRSCHRHLSAFRSQIKAIHRSAENTTMFVQTTQVHKDRRMSSSGNKPRAKLPYASQDFLCAQQAAPTKFYTISNNWRSEALHRHKDNARKNVRVHFHDSTMERLTRSEHSTLTHKHPDRVNGEEQRDEPFQCTAL